jgi:hypothetical protein
VSAARPGLAEVLDEGADLVRAGGSSFVGLLVLTALPLRLGQAHFAARVVELGDQAAAHGDHLRFLALALSGALVLSLFGRAVFVRALSLRGRMAEAPAGAAFRLSAAGFAAYVVLALLLEAAFYATCLLGLLAPVFVVLSGLLAALSLRLERAGLVEPLRHLGRFSAHGVPLVGLLLVFAAAFGLAVVNLYLLFRLGLWAASGLPGFQAAAWSGLLEPGNPRFLCALLAGGILLLEPYWLASLVAYAQKLESRKTGEDLRLWFARLRSSEGS